MNSQQSTVLGLTIKTFYTGQPSKQLVPQEGNIPFVYLFNFTVVYFEIGPNWLFKLTLSSWDQAFLLPQLPGQPGQDLYVPIPPSLTQFPCLPQTGAFVPLKESSNDNVNGVNSTWPFQPHTEETAAGERYRCVCGAYSRGWEGTYLLSVGLQPWLSSPSCLFSLLFFSPTLTRVLEERRGP